MGVNSQIESGSGSNAGIGYAVPVDTVKEVVSQLLESGEVQHAYLGVQLGEDAVVGEVVQAARPTAQASGGRRHPGNRREVGRR